MKKSKNYYAGVGMAIGTGISGAIFMTIFALTGNAIFIPFVTTGTVIGLTIGSVIDKEKGKSK